MTIVVPFDGSPLAEAALVRATDLCDALEQPVLAVSVIPRGNAKYARERGWLEPGEAFDGDAIVGSLHRQVTSLAPSANFRHEAVGRYAPTGSIARTIRRVAIEENASMVVLGSENAGRIVTAMSTVGTNVAADDRYDVLIVRHATPARVARVRA
ncbi:universal stress protein [Natrarchaeobaculum aegyptiacum]|uniref:Universal stress protein n=1 Tax=Natrarchaeobaculum aegyptiacum TaxID=745377 RepID=A0A2Z2HXT5_9EURY|nr:universal stress protein [Natrarchaeobaculum aegyptiacum]ARS89794.1 universal stress protein [Natrarchaeobaculum aegyptiacum]